MRKIILALFFAILAAGCLQQKNSWEGYSTETGGTELLLAQNDSNNILNFGVSGSVPIALAQSFKLNHTSSVDYIVVYFGTETGVLSGTFVMSLQTDNGGVPSNIYVDANAVRSIANASLNRTANNTFGFPTSIILNGNTTYHMVLHNVNYTETNGYIPIAMQTGNIYPDGGTSYSNNNGTTWTNQGTLYDWFFQIYGNTIITTGTLIVNYTTGGTAIGSDSTFTPPANLTINATNYTGYYFTNWTTNCNPGFLIATTTCYQESANVSNQSGKDGNCGLNYSGVYSAFVGLWTTPERMVDGDLATAAGSTGAASVEFSYQKPQNATNNSLWYVKADSGAAINSNFTIPASCWNYNATSMVFNVTRVGSLTGYCKNSTGYAQIWATTISNIIYEDAMWWNITNPEIDATNPNTKIQVNDTTACFAQANFGGFGVSNLTVNSTYGGNVAGNNSGTLLPANFSINVTSVNSGFSFVNWTVTTGNCTISNASAMNTTIQVFNASLCNAQANFFNITINATFGTNISTIQFRPLTAYSLNVQPTNQTSSNPLFNVTINAGTASINMTQTPAIQGFSVKCTTTYNYAAATILNSTSQLIGISTYPASFGIWCWADFNGPFPRSQNYNISVVKG